MRPGAETKPQPSASLTEEMFREAIELAHRVNRRVTDTDLVRRDRDEKPRANDAAAGR